MSDNHINNRPLSGFKKFAQLPLGEVIVSMVSHQGCMYVASDVSVYMLTPEGVLRKLRFEYEESEAEP